MAALEKSDSRGSAIDSMGEITKAKLRQASLGQITPREIESYQLDKVLAREFLVNQLSILSAVAKSIKMGLLAIFFEELLFALLRDKPILYGEKKKPTI